MSLRPAPSIPLARIIPTPPEHFSPLSPETQEEVSRRCRVTLNLLERQGGVDPPLLPTSEELLPDGTVAFDDILRDLTEEGQPLEVNGVRLKTISTISGELNPVHAVLKASLPSYSTSDDKTTNYERRTLLAEAMMNQIDELFDLLWVDTPESREVIAKIETLAQPTGGMIRLRHDLIFFPRRRYDPLYAALLYDLLLNVEVRVVEVRGGKLIDQGTPRWSGDVPLVILVDRYGHYEPLALKSEAGVITVFSREDPILGQTVKD